MPEILKMLQDFNEDLADCAIGIPIFKHVVLGVGISLYNNVRKALGLPPE